MIFADIGSKLLIKNESVVFLRESNNIYKKFEIFYNCKRILFVIVYISFYIYVYIL